MVVTETKREDNILLEISETLIDGSRVVLASLNMTSDNLGDTKWVWESALHFPIPTGIVPVDHGTLYNPSYTNGLGGYLNGLINLVSNFNPRLVEVESGQSALVNKLIDNRDVLLNNDNERHYRIAKRCVVGNTTTYDAIKAS